MLQDDVTELLTGGLITDKERITENPLKAKVAEPDKGEVRRTPLLGSRMNKDKREGAGAMRPQPLSAS